MSYRYLWIVIAVILSLSNGFAADFVEDSSSSESGDSTFDPFSDYSEFEEGSDEEADVNFFHNGRFFSLGIVGGYEGLTDVLGKMEKPGFGYGLFLSYFFDLRFALQILYFSADHSLQIVDGSTNTTYNGKTQIQRFEFDIKYYLNTQNVTKGLAALNPYLLVGISNYYRTRTFNTTSGYARDTAMGLQVGAGLEVPIMRNKMFVGAQATYNYVSFPDEGGPIVIDSSPKNINPTGDIYNIIAIIGVNF